MRFEGQLTSWDAERGFGFIEPAGGGQEIFLHVSAVPTNFRPPKLGQQFTFEVTLNREGKKRASNVGVAVARGSGRVTRPGRRTQWSAASALAIPVFVAVYITMAVTRGVSIWFALAYAGFSIVTLLA
jgi:cold shock CspA family protein